MNEAMSMSITEAGNSPNGEVVRSGRKRRRNKGKQVVKNILADTETKQFANKKTIFNDEEIPEPVAENDLPAIANGIAHKNDDSSNSRSEENPETINESPRKKTKKIFEDNGRKLHKNTSESRPENGPKKVVYNSDEEEDGDDEKGDFFESKNISRFELRKRSEELLAVRKTLPIYQHKDVIMSYFEKNQVTVVIGETGSGKSTQIPQFLMGTASKQIAVTQPRRVAAASLAARVSQEYGCRLGEEVGYQVRFSNVTSGKKTKLKYLTDGMLLRELILDRKLTKYSIIVIDEAHERTILTDLILGFLRELIVNKERPDLKVIVMSATLNADLFSKFFSNAPILLIEGKMYPVSKYYLRDKSDDIVDTTIRAIVQVNTTEPEGDILCFLPGQEEIDNCVSTLNSIAPHLPKETPLIEPFPLYAALSANQQLKVFLKLKGRKRKVILATNIAETSITVSGVKYVIDSGLRKVKVWKHSLGLSTLLTAPISQASAVQRAGRAGRESAGKVFRLYLEDLYLNKLPKQQESEILRNDVIFPILTLKKLDVDDLLNWSWLEHPGRSAILSALHTLHQLGALDEQGKITPLGHKISVLPLPPQLSVVLLGAMEYGVLQPVMDIVACLSVDNLILTVGSRDGELRDEVNFKRRNYCPLGSKLGDLIALKEYFDVFCETKDKSVAKEWCKELHFSFKGFQSALKVRRQLLEYLLAMVRQDQLIDETQRQQQLRNLRASLLQEADDNYKSLILDTDSILKSFLKGYIHNTAVGMPDRSYRTLAAGQLISIHPSSNLFGRVNLLGIMYLEYVYTSKGYARNCSVIDLAWLQEIAPHLLGTSKINVKEE